MQTDLTQELSEDEMPLFPLNVVLFPGGVLPLHIFEQRYRLMIQFCLDNERLFGVVLIKKGREVGEPAEPHLVGTAVKIIEVDRLEDGRMNLLTLGQHRFEIMKIRRDLPYLVGQVRALGTDNAETHDDLRMSAVGASQLYQAYESLLAELVPDWKAVEEIPPAPDHLSYQIGIRLQIPLTDKQRLLETLSIDQLLSREIELLEQENQKLRANLIARRTLEKGEPTDIPPWKKASLN
jgi:Lon protease-like protein